MAAEISRWNYDENQDFCMAPKYFPTWYLLITKKKNNTCIVEKPDRHTSNQAIKVNITSNKASCTHWHNALQRVQNDFCDIFAKHV